MGSEIKQFDPYYSWLGIPPDEQPPNHYRLLTIELYEDDAEVISNAADRVMGHLRNHQTGPRAAHSQELLNEVAKVRLCLLNAEKKAAYDAQLKRKLAPAKQLPVKPRLTPAAPSASKPNLTGAVRNEVHAVPMPLPTSRRRARNQAISSRRQTFLVAGGAVAVVAVAVAAYIALQKPAEPATAQADDVNGAAKSHTSRDSKTAKLVKSSTKKNDQTAITQPEVQAKPTETQAAETPPPEKTDDVPVTTRQNSLPKTSEFRPQTWRYTFEEPAADWATLNFDDSAWQEGPGGFGDGKTQAAVVNTPWTTSDIWLRQSFEVADPAHFDAAFRAYYDDGVEVYVNDVIAANLPGYTWTYIEAQINPDARKVIRAGRNVLAVRCHNRAGPQYIDVGFAPASPSVAAVTAETARSGYKIDLLRLVNPMRDSVQGNWKRDGSEMVSSAASLARLQIPFVPPKDYCLTLVGERLDGKDCLLAGLVVGGHQVCAVVDGWSQTASSIEMISGARESSSPAYQLLQHALEKNKPFTLAYIVHPRSATIELDGDVVTRWDGDPQTLEPTKHWAVPQTDKLWLGTHLSRFRIRELTLTALDADGKPDASAHLEQNIPATSGAEAFLSDIDLVDVHQHGGVWLKTPIEVQEVKLPHGILLHPPLDNVSSHATFNLAARFRAFESQVSLQDGRVPKTGLTFRVEADGREIWRSAEVRTQADVQSLALDVTGVRQLTLSVECPGSNSEAWATWIEPKLIK